MHDCMFYIYVSVGLFALRGFAQVRLGDKPCSAGDPVRPETLFGQPCSANPCSAGDPVRPDPVRPDPVRPALFGQSLFGRRPCSANPCSAGDPVRPIPARPETLFGQSLFGRRPCSANPCSAGDPVRPFPVRPEKQCVPCLCSCLDVLLSSVACLVVSLFSCHLARLLSFEELAFGQFFFVISNVFHVCVLVWMFSCHLLLVL
jgi:hypothetical protein